MLLQRQAPAMSRPLSWSRHAAGRPATRTLPATQATTRELQEVAELLQRAALDTQTLEALGLKSASVDLARVASAGLPMQQPSAPASASARAEDRMEGVLAVLVNQSNQHSVTSSLQWAISNASEIGEFSYLDFADGSRHSSSALAKKVLSAFLKGRGFWIPISYYVPEQEALKAVQEHYHREEKPEQPGWSTEIEGMAPALAASVQKFAPGFAAGSGATITVGSKVRVKPSIKQPSMGWGSVQPGSVGTVRKLDNRGRECRVDFPEENNWPGVAAELEVVTDNVSMPVEQIAENGLRVGMKVRVKAAAHSVPELGWQYVQLGSVGTIVEVLPARQDVYYYPPGRRVIVDFPELRDCLARADDLELVMPDPAEQASRPKNWDDLHGNLCWQLVEQIHALTGVRPRTVKKLNRGVEQFIIYRT